MNKFNINIHNTSHDDIIKNFSHSIGDERPILIKRA
jgi:hypothetical protein